MRTVETVRETDQGRKMWAERFRFSCHHFSATSLREILVMTQPWPNGAAPNRRLRLGLVPSSWALFGSQVPAVGELGRPAHGVDSALTFLTEGNEDNEGRRLL